jgi:hypothetical protein
MAQRAPRPAATAAGDGASGEGGEGEAQAEKVPAAAVAGGKAMSAGGRMAAAGAGAGKAVGKPVGTQKVGRNDPCPCGSGKKYKKCHGRAANVARHLSCGRRRTKRTAAARRQSPPESPAEGELVCLLLEAIGIWGSPKKRRRPLPLPLGGEHSTALLAGARTWTLSPE